MTFDPLPDDLAAAADDAAARASGFAGLFYRAEVDSTNDVVLSLAAAGAPEGTAVLADVQRAGRGRRGRQWFSPPGAGVYLSVLMRPRGPDGGLSMITLAAGNAVARAVSAASGLPVELKWPNDLVIGRPWRKLGGVLCEASGAGARVEAVVIGVGINVRQVAYPREIADRATSIEIELGRPFERGPLVGELLAGLLATIQMLHAGSDDAIRRTWRHFGRAGLHGASVSWQERGGTRRGRAREIDEDGALLVEVDGRVERLVSGEVTWESLSGD